MKSLYSHPKVGASWAGFVIEQVLMMEPHGEVFFWATHQGAEIDLILRRGGVLYGVECKRADTPRLNPSIRIALDDLGLNHVFVINVTVKPDGHSDLVTGSRQDGSPLFSRAPGALYLQKRYCPERPTGSESLF